ncbi:hypothetical protein [Microbacterium jejuense]|uniref:hypothetical protein n=1 Tax=Microbacterium jejuense TaxID=1263637 RepID=UPI0031E633EC
MTTAPSLLYLGDSHVRYFAKAAAFDLLHPYVTDGIEVGGATAVGMRNPNSKTDAIGRFRKWVVDKDRDSVVVVHLGEVDCGYVIWYRADRYDEPVEIQMRESIGAYFEFVDELRQHGFTRIIITGATLPTITDDDQLGEVVVARSSIAATMAERTALTLEYNRLLAQGAVARGLAFVDIAEDVLDPTTGVVHTKMRNPNPADHHMNVAVAAAYWARRLTPELGRITSARERRWTATRDTYLKGFPAHSSRIPAELLVRVSAGEVVVAEKVAAHGDHTIVRNVRFRDQSHPLIRVLPSRHFTRHAGS